MTMPTLTVPVWLVGDDAEHATHFSPLFRDFPAARQWADQYEGVTIFRTVAEVDVRPGSLRVVPAESTDGTL